MRLLPVWSPLRERKGKISRSKRGLGWYTGSGLLLRGAVFGTGFGRGADRAGPRLREKRRRRQHRNFLVARERDRSQAQAAEHFLAALLPNPRYAGQHGRLGASAGSAGGQPVHCQDARASEPGGFLLLLLLIVELLDRRGVRPHFHCKSMVQLPPISPRYRPLRGIGGRQCSVVWKGWGHGQEVFYAKSRTIFPEGIFFIFPAVCIAFLNIFAVFCVFAPEPPR